MKKIVFVIAAIACASTTPVMGQMKSDTSDSPLGFGSSHIDITLPPSQSFLRTPTSFGGGVLNFESQSRPWETREFGLENNSINNSVSSPSSYVTAPMNFRSLGMNMTTHPMQAEALQPSGYGGYQMARTLPVHGASASIGGMSSAGMIERLNESISGGGAFGAGLGGGFGAGANRLGTGGIGGSLFGPGGSSSGSLGGFGGFGAGSFGF